MSNLAKPAVHVQPQTRHLASGLVAEGKLVQAVKLVRGATGLDLRSAKEYVDTLKLEYLARGVPPEVEAAALDLIAKGEPGEAAKVVRRRTHLGSRDAKLYVEAMRAGYGRGRSLSDRVRAFTAVEDYASAIAVVQDETGMTREEAERFVTSLD
ncbi:hypothetical protein ACFY4C_30160 [Actinomadura viridis]|uniref:hypothetical protein n=1 Tax=Actinomadura viridis TaxID=58110 RepID=UPI00369BBDE6